MSLFSGITNAIGLTQDPNKTQFNYTTPQTNQALYGNMVGDTAALRGLASNPITGLSQAGLAQQQYAQGLFGQQRNQMMNDAMSSQATAQANMARYGTDAGAGERLNTSLGRDRMLAAQRFGANQASTMQGIAADDFGRQQQNQFTALMALPQISQSQYGQDFNIAQNQADIQNKYNALNVGNRLTAENENKSAMGNIGALAGGIFGGPLGALAGGTIGRLF